MAWDEETRRRLADDVEWDIKIGQSAPDEKREQHGYDVAAALEELDRLKRPDGTMVFTAPGWDAAVLERARRTEQAESELQQRRKRNDRRAAEGGVMKLNVPMLEADAALAIRTDEPGPWKAILALADLARRLAIEGAQANNFDKALVAEAREAGLLPADPEPLKEEP
jgi:hypothetical protein